jgi:mannitol-1-phosphate/altronate dehydrogenase
MVSSLFPSDKKQINSICIGSGRFLRAVLVPALVASNMKPIIVQTRGRNFIEYCASRKEQQQQQQEQDDCWTYEVDTVEHDGKIKTDEIKCYGAGSLGTDEAKNHVLTMISQLENIKVIGVGVTEAGLASSSTKAMKDLFDILSQLATQFTEKRTACDNPHGKICIVNTDNVSQNGNAIAKFMMELAADSGDCEIVQTFIREKVIFLNSMVDRITSQREGSNGLVPRAEPTPAKALVIEDLGRDLPLELLAGSIKERFGVVVRTMEGQLNADIALKLRVANGTHTAAAHVMALCRLLMTDVLSSPQDSPNHDNATLLMKYLDSFFQNQIIQGVVLTDAFEANAQDAEDVYKDWRQRLIHSYFGLSTLFITQNGAAKGGIRIGPTIVDLVRHGKVGFSGDVTILD